MRPIRCITCGKLLADKYEEFDRRVRAGENPGTVLDEMGLKRYCCRTVMLTSVDLTEEIQKYRKW